MFKAIPGNHNYTISLFGEIKCVESTSSAGNKEECTPLVIDGKVKIEMYGVIQEVDLVWLSLIAHFEVNLPEQFRPYLNTISFIDCNLLIFRHNLSKKIMIFKNPMEIEGYRIIPGFTHLAIDKFGNIIDVKTNKPLNKRYHGRDKDYPMVWCYNPDKNRNSDVPVHRLVALAWVPNNDFIDKPIINHIDFNKQNYYYKNLEWVNNSGNVKHAHDNNLMLHATRCKVKNIITGEITEFKTMQEACKFMGIGFRTAPTMLKYPENYLIDNKYQVRTQNDNRPWTDKDYVYSYTPKPRQSRFTITLKYPDNSEKTYDGVRPIIKDFALWNTTVTVDDIVDKITKKFPDIKITYIDNYKGGFVQAYHIPTKTIIEAISVRELGRKIGMRQGTISKCLTRPENIRLHDYAFRYKVDKPWNTNFIEIGIKPMCISATNLSTGDKIDLGSLRKASTYFKVSRDTIVSRLKSKESLRNWTLEIKT